VPHEHLWQQLLANMLHSLQRLAMDNSNLNMVNAESTDRQFLSGNLKRIKGSFIDSLNGAARQISRRFSQVI
jgi:hypothetical protein